VRQGTGKVVAEPKVERVEFASRRGARLVGLWHVGQTDSAVILCHGMESSKVGTKAVRLATEFAAAGCHAIRFDFSYVGESEGAFADLTVSGEVDDLAGAWRFVRERIRGPVGIVGSSLGGAVALLFAAEEPGVTAVATIAAVAHPERFGQTLSAGERERWRRDGIYEWEGMRLRSSFLDDAENLDLLSAVERICGPLLLTHGTADTVVPCSDADEIAGRARLRPEVRLYEGADHRFSEPVLLDRLLGDIVAWMVERLGVG
jgi:putative redox protein